MRFILILSLLFSALLIRPAVSAPKNIESHSHNGRIHKHQLPASGKKHFHKHMHNGRAHIHPFSAEVGFNHTHNKKRTPVKKDKADTNSEELPRIEHKHGGRPHSHVLPPSGINHLHRHWHGKRAHTHPLTENGAIHFHPDLDEQISTTKTINFDQQVAELLKKPVRKTNTKKLNKKITPKKRPKKSKKKLVSKKVKNKKQQLKNKQLKRIKKQNNEREIEITNDQGLTKEDSDNVVSANRQYEIGLRYEHGTGVEQNLKQAVKWYSRAAEQGHTKAQFNLASLYENGEGVEKDLKLAVKWYKKAAEKAKIQNK